MSFWILPISGIPISCVTVQALTPAEQNTKEWQDRMIEYDSRIKERLKLKNIPKLPYDNKCEGDIQLSLTQDKEFLEEYSKVITSKDIPEQDDIKDSGDSYYLNMEIALPRGPDNELHFAKVKNEVLDRDGNPVGTYNSNPLLNSKLYEVEYLDGSTETLAANTIAENLFSQINDEGHRELLLDEIVDYRRNKNALSDEEACGKYTTQGWDIMVRWKDGSCNWIALKDLKQSYPVQLAEYATKMGIQDLPVFSWWIPYVLKKRNRIISKIKSKYWQRTHKYGIKIPKLVKHALQNDKENNNTFW